MDWKTSRFRLDLSRPRVMGIVNVTPDSFSDGGNYASLDAARNHCEQLVRDGADILDIGGESTRPGALELPVDEELARVLPVIRHAVTLGVPVSIDTYKPAVMQAALDLGADIVNDVWALRWRASPTEPSALDVVSAHPACGVCIMHMHRNPQTMQVAPMEGDVVPQVLSFLEHATQQLRGLGVDSSRICIDPGIGFGKTVPQNFALLAQQSRLLPLGYPVLAGWSRKSSLAAVTQRSLSNVATLDIRDRLVPSVTAALLAVQNGAHVVRVHDVKETVQALKVLDAMQQQETTI
ncbi:MAG: dihydropteroate synthase [Burkholderiales bacterium]|nr:dihydropteroate synthase [Burkholderiales bacterium]